MTAITDTKLRDKLIEEKKLELKKTIEMIKQDTYERKNRKNIIPEALITNRERNRRRTNTKNRKESVRDRKTEQQTKNRVNSATHPIGILHIWPGIRQIMQQLWKKGTFCTSMQTNREQQTENT